MKSIKKIVDFIGKILPSVGQVSFRYRNTNPKHQKEEARECPFQIDLIKGMAYELLCSSRAHNIQLTPKDDEKFLIDKILASYNDALKELKRNDQLNFYIEGGGWQRQTELFKANISKGDVYSNFLQIGTRVYKNFEAIKNTQFDVTA
ncbi:hypothetical protein KAR91_12485, partial [Candidatus Pacearchaeota archaeon]|nr:hypothetical protein [Candidatus Pacearchaeota archaeon]